jgi:hypothetical protein
MCFYNKVWNITLEFCNKFEMNILNIKYQKHLLKIVTNILKYNWINETNGEKQTNQLISNMIHLFVRNHSWLEI